MNHEHTIKRAQRDNYVPPAKRLLRHSPVVAHCSFSPLIADDLRAVGLVVGDILEPDDTATQSTTAIANPDGAATGMIVPYAGCLGSPVLRYNPPSPQQFASANLVPLPAPTAERSDVHFSYQTRSVDVKRLFGVSSNRAARS